jgi:hypothetical protein
MKNKIS